LEIAVKYRFLIASVLAVSGLCAFGCSEGESPFGHLDTRTASIREAELKKLRSSPYYGMPAPDHRADARGGLGALARQ
jgi:hypothetical protein